MTIMLMTLNCRSIPDYLSWFKYVSWFFYSTEILTVNQWDGAELSDCNLRRSINCFPNGTFVHESLEFYKVRFHNYFICFRLKKM